MESRGKDLGLRAIFAVRGDNPAFGQGTATVYTEQMAEMTVGHENERRRGKSEQYDDDANSTRAIVHSPGTILHGNDRRDREQEQPHNHKGHLGHRLLPSKSPDIVRNGCTLRGQSAFRHRRNYSQTGVNCTAGSRLRVAVRTLLKTRERTRRRLRRRSLPSASIGKGPLARTGGLLVGGVTAASGISPRRHRQSV